MNNKKIYKFAMAATLATSAIVIAAPTPANAAKSFPDVKAGTESGDAIINLSERGIISGFPDGTFKPGNAITRTQVAKILAGILKLDTVNVKNPNFKDVKPGDANYGAIAALANAGIISGSNGYFNPSKNITRGQMSKMLVKGFKLQIADKTEIPFTDVATGSEYVPFIQTLFANKITTGTTSTTYGPQANVTRSQLATFVVRAENVLNSATIFANKYNHEVIYATYGGIETAEDIFTWDEEQDMTDAITIKPLKEGTGKLVITGFSEEDEEAQDLFFLVTVTKVDGKLKATLKEVNEDDYLEDEPYIIKDGDLDFKPAAVSVKTVDGKTLSPDLYSFELKAGQVQLSIFEKGQYLVTFTKDSQQVTMAADVYSYNFIRSLDLYELINQITFTSEDLTFEATGYKFEDLGSEVPVKATIQDGKITLSPIDEGSAILNVTGKDGKKAYIYIEFYKIANQWAAFHEFIDEDDLDFYLDNSSL